MMDNQTRTRLIEQLVTECRAAESAESLYDFKTARDHAENVCKDGRGILTLHDAHFTTEEKAMVKSEIDIALAILIKLYGRQANSARWLLFSLYYRYKSECYKQARKRFAASGRL